MIEQDRPILLIEDDRDAADLMRMALKKAGLRRPLRVLADGDEAIAYLSNEENPAPCLLLLDVRLPRKSGLEVLTWLRSRANTRPLPVLMLTASMSPKDIEEALKLGIGSYVVKPTNFDDLKKVARMIRRKVDGIDAGAEEDDPTEIELAPPRQRPPSTHHRVV